MPKNMQIKTTFTAVDRTSKTLGKIQSRVALLSSRMSRGMNRATSAVNNFSGKLTGALKTGFMAVGAAAAGAFLAIGHVAQKMDDLAKIARAINFPIEEFQEWRFVAEQSGIEAESFEKSLTIFTKNFSAAQEGMGPLASKLKKMNPELLKSFKGAKSSSEGFDLLIKAMRDAPTEAQRNVLALTAFGKSGTKMINISRASAEEVEKLKNEMRENGIITAQQAAEAEKYDDMMNRLKLTLFGSLMPTLQILLPIMTEFANSLREWLVLDRQGIADNIKKAFEWLAKNKDEILIWAKRIGIAIATFYALQAAMNAVNLVLKIFNLLASMNPIGLIVIAFLLAIAAVWYFRDEIDEAMAHVFDYFAEIAAAMKGVWSALIDYFYFVMEPLTWFFEQSFAIWGEILSFFADLWNGDWQAMADRFVGIWDFIKSYYMGLWNGLLSFFQGIWSGMKWAYQAFSELLSGDFDALGARFSGLWDGIKTKAGEALDWILNKIQPVLDLVKSLGLLGAAWGGQTNLVEDQAGKLGNAGWSGPKVPESVLPQAQASASTFDETYNTSEQKTTVNVVIEDKTKSARVKRGKLPDGMRLVHSGAAR